MHHRVRGHCGSPTWFVRRFLVLLIFGDWGSGDGWTNPIATTPYENSRRDDGCRGLEPDPANPQRKTMTNVVAAAATRRLSTLIDRVSATSAMAEFDPISTMNAPNFPVDEPIMTWSNRRVDDEYMKNEP